MGKKAALQISFAWLFAIIVGAFILVLAIYGVTKVIDTGDQGTSAQAGKEVSVLLNPLETGFEAGQTTLLSMPVETRIKNDCKDDESFGLQRISLSQKSFNKWTETNVNVAFKNKYIFSDNVVEGKDFFLFSKPFEFPFKVSDVIYLTSAQKEYCFANAPKRINDEISALKQANLFTKNCPEESIKVCFSGYGSNCDIDVDENLKSVEKRGMILYYETDALMYAVIFAEKDGYECHAKRLMKKTSELAMIYDDKTSIISNQGCLPEVNLLGLEDSANNYKDSSDLAFIANDAEAAESENKFAECRLW